MMVGTVPVHAPVVNDPLVVPAASPEVYVALQLVVAPAGGV
jgi:hypothetical protein